MRWTCATCGATYTGPTCPHCNRVAHGAASTARDLAEPCSQHTRAANLADRTTVARAVREHPRAAASPPLPLHQEASNDGR